MRASLALLALSLVATPALSQAPPGLRMNGIDPVARSLLASDEPVGFAARCVVDLVRRSWHSTTQEERSAYETGAAGLTRAMPDIARASGVDPDRARTVLALATMPLATFSIGLVPGREPAADAGPGVDCLAAGKDPGNYVAGIGKR